MFEVCEQLAAGNVSAIADCPFAQGFGGGIAGGALIAGMILIGVILLAALYVYTSMAWMTIAKKLKYKRPWLAWIPFADQAMKLQIGGFHWAWIFLILIPILGWIALFILIIIATWRIYEQKKYPGWFSLASIIPKAGSILYLIVIGFVAWQDKSPNLRKRIPLKRK